KMVESGDTPTDWRDALYYHYYEFPGFHSVRAHYGIKKQRFKLIHFYKENCWELYDLQEDPLEMNNIYDHPQMTDIKDELKAQLVAYKINTKCLKSTENNRATYEKAAYPLIQSHLRTDFLRAKYAHGYLL